MGLFSRFESKAEDLVEGSVASARGGIEPVKLAKRACKAMEREKMVGVGHEYAPTLYNVLVSPEDDARMGGYYPSLAGEVETYLTSRAEQTGLTFDCPPLVRFIVDEGLKRGKFDIIAESVSPAIIEELRHEEMVHYGIEAPAAGESYGYDDYGYNESSQSYGAFEPEPYEPLPYEPEPAEPAAFDPEPFAAAAAAAAPAAAAAARNYPPVEDPAADGRTVILDQVQEETPHATLVDRRSGACFEVSSARATIGRESSCDVVVLDPSVSRHHAELLYADGGWLVRDTGSTNGTSVNGAPATQSRVYDGDVIDLGKTQLEFQEG